MNTKTLVGILLLFSVLLCGYAGLMIIRTPSDEPAPPGTSVALDVKPKASAESRPAEESVPVERAAIPESAKKDARPPKGGSVTGTVLRVDKSLAPGADVTVWHLTWKAHEQMDEDASIWRTVSDDEGKFRIEGLPMGRYFALCYMEGENLLQGFSLSKEKPDADIRIQLWKAGRIAGRVEDTTGAPVQNAEVFAYGWKNDRGRIEIMTYESFFTRSTTDSAGRFLIDPYNAGTYTLCVKAKGYATLISDEVEADGTEFTLVVSKGARVSGEVVYANSGEPAAGMRMTLAGSSGVALKEAVSDQSGRFHFSDLPTGDHRIVTDDESMLIKAGTGKFSVEEGRETTGLRVKLEEGGVITGRIYDEKTEAGLRGVTVHAISQDIERRIRRKSTTDWDGTYRLEGLASATYEVRHDEVRGYESDWHSSRRTVLAKVGDSVLDIDYALATGLRVFGTVEDEQGRPIADASVSCYSLSPEHSASHGGQTDEDGSFILAGLAPSTEYSLFARKKRMVILPTEHVQIHEEDVEGVRIVMTTASALGGTVVDRNGKPLTGMRVETKNLDTGRRNGTTPTKKNGAFEINMLAAGRHGILLFKNGHWSDDVPFVMEVTLAKGEERTGLRLMYEGPKGLSISGRVTDRKGKPLEGASLNARGKPSSGYGKTNEKGEYEISGLVAGNHSVSVRHGSHSSAIERDIPAGSTGIDFALAGRGTVSGTVIDARSGKPVTDFEMYQRKGTWNEVEPRTVAYFRSFHDNEGRFSLNNLEEGDATITVRANGYALTFEHVFGAVENDAMEDIVIRLEPGVVLDGVVADSAGNPVAKAQIYSGPVPNEWERERGIIAQSKSDGTFQLESLLAGANTIGVYHPDFLPAQIDIDLLPNYKNTVHITLTGGGVVETGW